jgi:hypothetical protein
LSAGLPLRLYANPIKQVLYLLICTAFVATGLWIIQSPGPRGRSFAPIFGWFAVVFFGLSTVVILITFVVYVLLRRPVVLIDGHGWSYVSGLSPKAQHVDWQGITRIALFRHKFQSGYRSQTHYHLVLFGEAGPFGQTLPRLRARLQKMYPMFRGAIMTVPLNTLFFRTTTAKCVALLERIEAACGQEMALYDIRIEPPGVTDI